MLLINPLSENWTLEIFNAIKTYKSYIDFYTILVYILLQFLKIFVSLQLINMGTGYYYDLQTPLMINFN